AQRKGVGGASRGALAASTQRGDRGQHGNEDWWVGDRTHGHCGGGVSSRGHCPAIATVICRGGPCGRPAEVRGCHRILRAPTRGAPTANYSGASIPLNESLLRLFDWIQLHPFHIKLIAAYAEYVLIVNVSGGEALRHLQRAQEAPPGFEYHPLRRCVCSWDTVLLQPHVASAINQGAHEERKYISARPVAHRLIHQGLTHRGRGRGVGLRTGALCSGDHRFGDRPRFDRIAEAAPQVTVGGEDRQVIAIVATDEQAVARRGDNRRGPEQLGHDSHPGDLTRLDDCLVLPLRLGHVKHLERFSRR